ncbi:MAG: M13 family metallopeptidase [Crocinitomicaceae bacterium]
MKHSFVILGLTGLLLQACAGTKNENKTSANSYQTIDVTALDRTIKPSDDFFTFANGTWVAKTEIPASESRWGSFNELEQQNNIKLKAILNEAVANPGAKGSQNQLLGAYFKSFTDMQKRDQLGIAPLKEDLQKIENLQNTAQIQGLLSSFHKDGIGTLFGYGIGQDLKNVNINVAYMGQGGIGLPNRDYYFDEKYQSVLTAYEQHISRCFGLAGLSTDPQIATQILALEKALASAMLRPSEMREPEKTYNKQSLAEVAKSLGSNVNFEAYLKAMGATLPDSIIVSNPAFNTQVAELLQSVDLKTWKNYFSWCLINHYAGHLNSALVQANFDFYEGVLSGKKEQQPIDEQAIEAITNLEIGELLGKAFVDKHFSKAAQDRVNEMVDNLLIVYRERIEKLDWMTDITKQEALKKLNSIGRKLGYPSKWEDYSMLNFDAAQYVMNVKEMARYSVQKNFSELGKPVDKDKWGMPAHMVNAYYHPLLNEIAFPAGIMQAPFFDEKAEDAVNYGRIGMVIGHEFTHGFDDMGSKFAADGSFTNWWTEEDRQSFEEKTKLLGATFAGFCPMDNHCVNPDLTMGENIADLGGLTIAYYAYKRTDEYKKQELREGFTPEQRFFIAYAQLWKIKYTEAEMKKRLATDPHSPGMYRVNGPLKNCPEFFEAFQIEEGREMRNDVKRVARIW